MQDDAGNGLHQRPQLWVIERGGAYVNCVEGDIYPDVAILGRTVGDGDGGVVGGMA